MKVTCPACESIYRIPDDKIQGRGARITCKKCGHKFVVYNQSERVVIGEDKPKGLPVTFQRKGQITKAEMPDEDDEADAPTTVMTHGSALAQEIKQAIADAAEDEPAAPAPAPAAAAAAPPKAANNSGGNGKMIGIAAAAVVLCAIVAVAVFLQ